MMNKIFQMIILCGLITASAFSESRPQAQVYSDIQEGQRFTNSVAVGIIFSAMSKCVGENPDSEIAKVAGSLLVSTAIAEFHKAKLDQIDPYTYSYDQTGLVNDAQKLSITGEQIINNQKYLSVLKDKRLSEESVKKSIAVAEGVALRQMQAMSVHEADCLAGIYDGAYKPIWRPIKKYWIYGECARDWGDSHYYFTDICPQWKAAEDAATTTKDGKKKSSADLAGLRFKCQKGANATAYRSRMFDIKSKEDCLQKCGIAAEVSLVCKPVQKIVREYGLPTIKSLLNTIEPSSYNAAKILRVHHNTFTKMFQVCKRDELLKELKSIKSVSTKYDPQFEKIRGDSADIYQKYGGLASSDINLYRTDVNRSADDVHKVDVGEKPTEEEIKQFSVVKENLFSDIPVDTTIVGPGKPICGDWATRGCGEYSKLLMKSLNSCSETLHSTVYTKMYDEVIHHYAAVPSSDMIYYDTILKTFKYFAEKGSDIFLDDVHAKTFTDTVGGAIGLGGGWLTILRKNQSNLINVFDPLLATYNKRILAYQIARDLIDLSLTNTKKNIARVETRLTELHAIKSTLDKTKPLPSMPIISAAITKDVDHKFSQELKSILDIICENADCANVSKKLSDITTPSNHAKPDMKQADENVLKASTLVSSIGDTLFTEKKITKGITDRMTNLESLGDSIEKGINVLAQDILPSKDDNSKLVEIKKQIFELFDEDESSPKANAFIEPTPTPSNLTDASVFYKEIKESGIRKDSTVALTASEEMPEYETLSDKTLSTFQNDIINDDDTTLWMIISNRYAKVQERVNLVE